MIWLYRTFNFEAAHYLDDYEGKCGHIHGHNYVLTVYVGGTPDSTGFIVESDQLKRIMNPLMTQLDHALIIENRQSFAFHTSNLSSYFWSNIFELNVIPTTENLAQYIHTVVSEALPRNSIRISLQETHAMGVIVE